MTADRHSGIEHPGDIGTVKIEFVRKGTSVIADVACEQMRNNRFTLYTRQPLLQDAFHEPGLGVIPSSRRKPGLP
mgnify:CR=1 FL=1